MTKRVAVDVYRHYVHSFEIKLENILKKALLRSYVAMMRPHSKN